MALERKKMHQYGCEKARKHIYVTDRHDMFLSVKMALKIEYNQTKQNSIAHTCI